MKKRTVEDAGPYKRQNQIVSPPSQNKFVVRADGVVGPSRLREPMKMATNSPQSLSVTMT